MLINNKQVKHSLIKKLIFDARAKKELRNVDAKVVRSETIKFLKQNPKICAFLATNRTLKQFERAGDYELIVKHVRNILRKSYGMFVVDAKSRGEILNKINSLLDIWAHEEMLRTHESTKERLKIYPELYRKIFKITGKPASILDLGCGMNPFSYPFLGARPSYYASDISKEDCDLINSYFKKFKITGEAIPLDLREIKHGNILMFFPKTDVCFLFKVLDSIETSGHKLAEKLINSINSDYVAASFSTKTLSGKRMRHPYRGWVEQMCRRLGFGCRLVEFENELFYVIKKNSEFMSVFKEKRPLVYHSNGKPFKKQKKKCI